MTFTSLLDLCPAHPWALVGYVRQNDIRRRVRHTRSSKALHARSSRELVDLGEPRAPEGKINITGGWLLSFVIALFSDCLSTNSLQISFLVPWSFSLMQRLHSLSLILWQYNEAHESWLWVQTSKYFLQVQQVHQRMHAWCGSWEYARGTGTWLIKLRSFFSS